MHYDSYLAIARNIVKDLPGDEYWIDVDAAATIIADALASVAAAQRERDAQLAEAPFGPGLADRDDYWQPRIAARIRAQS